MCQGQSRPWGLTHAAFDPRTSSYRWPSGAFEADVLTWVFAGHPLKIRDEGLLAVGDFGFILSIVCADVLRNRFGGSVLIEHEVVEGHGVLAISIGSCVAHDENVARVSAAPARAQYSNTLTDISLQMVAVNQLIEGFLRQSVSTFGGLAAYFCGEQCTALLIHPSLEPTVPRLTASTFLDWVDEKGKARILNREAGPLTFTVESVQPVCFRGELVDYEVGRVLTAKLFGAMSQYDGHALSSLDDVQRERLLLADAEAIARCGTWQWDAASGEVRWSAGIYKITGIDPSLGPLPFEAQDRLYGEHFARLAAAVQTCIENGTPYALDLELAHPNGKVWTHARGHRIVDPDTGAIRLIGTLQDIDERKAYERALERTADELRVARDKAQAADQSKSEFLANMSHELRTPLNGVIASASLLVDAGLDVDGRDLVDTIRSSGSSLLVLINDILDFSKIEAGELSIEPHDFELETLLEELAHTILPLVHESRNRIVLQMGPGLPAVVRGDSTRLRQVIMNLLANAAKFTVDGVITIDVADGGHGRLRFAVSDTGIGIAEDVRERLFRPFTQADASTTRRYGGTGLGLSISWRLVRMMGGQLDLYSEVGVGSTFYFELPLAPVRGADDELNGVLRTERIRLKGASSANMQRLRRILRTAGAELTDSEPTLTIASAEGDSVPHGADICLWCDRGPRDRPSGMLHLFQPVRRRTLIDACRQARRTPMVAEAATVKLRETSNATRVLVVDDNPVNRKVAARIFSRLGIEVALAEDGTRAVEACRDATYDLVLMDIQMPDMDGFEVTRAIRQEHGEKAPDVVAFTASAVAAERDLAFEAGMVDFLMKPIQLEDVRQLLRTYPRT